MFDVGASELLVIGAVALIVIGPKELPGLLRTAGAAMNKVRRMASEFRGQFDEAMREAELDQAKKAFTDVSDMANSAKTTFNPMESIRSEIQSLKDEIKPTIPSVPEPKIDIPTPPLPTTPVSLEPPPPAAAAAPAKRVRAKKPASGDAA
jgi:sec-independent protein translocase protein TatB